MYKGKAYRQIQLGFAAAAICIGFFVAITYINMEHSVKESRNVNTVLRNLLLLENVLTEVQAVETGERGYVLTGEEVYFKTHNKGLENLKENIGFLLEPENEDVITKAKQLELASLIERKINNSLNAVSLRMNKGYDSAVSFIKSGEGAALMSKLKNIVNNLEERDRQLLREANAANENAAKATTRQFIFLAIFFYLIFFISYRVIINDFKKKLAVADKLKYNASLINSLSDPIITTDREMRIINWNKYATELYGWEEPEVLGKSLREVLGTRYSDSEYKRNVTNYLKNGVWRGEAVHTHKNGHTLYVLATLTALKNEDGELVGGVEVIRDITERKVIEKKLQELTENLEKEVKDKVSELNNVFERITDAFIAIDNNWCYTYVNEKAAAMHNLTPADLIGKNIWDLFPDVVNEDFYTALHKARETMQPLRLELFYSKTKQWFEDHIYPSPDGISVYYHDVTEKKKIEFELHDAESKFRSLVEASSVGVYIVQNSTIIYANPCFADMFGYTSDYLINEMNLMDLVSPTDKGRVMQNISNRIRDELKSMNYEFEGMTSKGTIINVEVFGTRMLYKGEPAIIGTIINITERKKALMRLRASEEELRLSNEQFILVAKATNDAIWDWNLQSNIIRGNESFARLFDTDPNESVTYETFIGRMHPDDAARVIRNYKEALLKKSTYLSGEFRLRMGNGSYRNINDRAYVLYDNTGRPYRMLGAMQDITVQKKGEQQLMIEKELSDSIINRLPGIFYLYNREGKFYRWNKNLERVTGYSVEEIKKLHPADLFRADERELINENINNVFMYGEDSVEAHIFSKYRDEILYYFSGMAISYEGEECIMGIGIDLTDRVKSQQQLVDSEEKFRTLIEQASDGIFISNQIGDYLVVNSSAALLTGYTKEELLEMNMKEVIFEMNMEPSSFRIKELLSGEPVIGEKIIRQKNGNLVNVEISSKLLPDGRFQGIVRDITTRKWAEEGLRYSEEMRRLIMNASLDAIICIDTNGDITFWNPQSEKMFGWKAEEVYGKILSDIIIPEKYREMHNRGIRHYLLTGEGNVFNKVLELSGINRSGTEFPIELTVLPIKQGSEEFFCAFIRDITSRKNAEEEVRISEHKYRLLFDQNPMPMWMISLPERNFLAVNTSAVEFYGYEIDEFLSMNIKDLRPVEEDQSAGNMISTYKSGINNTGIWEHRKKDGTLVRVNLITHDIIYQGKHAKLVLANDMTEKIRAEEKLKSSHDELRELATHLQNIRETERTHMAREIHDELGQQLTGLKMDISWINRKLSTADKELKQKMADTLTLIDGTVRTVRRISTQLRPSILDDLGIVAAMEWQSEEFQKRSEIRTIFRSNLANIDISTELATGIFRIFQESLTNVVRHAHASKVEAMLSVKDGSLILSISDNGVGFNAKEIENKKTLGLLGMKERTLIMGGSYEITSKPGKGTTVVIIVPIQIKE